MIHPHTEVKKVNDHVGLGVFATKFIPKGTITFAVDDMDVKIPADKLSIMSEAYQELIEKYAYVDEHGTSIVSWDHGKYVNHCCEPNSISTGYGFEIAIKDIHPGEQITDEYALFNLTIPMSVGCDNCNCRKMVHPDDVLEYAPKWDLQIKEALNNFQEVYQPLASFLSDDVKSELEQYLLDKTTYKSVLSLQYRSRSFDESQYEAVEV